MKLTLIPNRHPDEDVFENYLFNRLTENEVANFEEHLLVCERCQDTLAQTEDYIRVLKAATAAHVAEQRSVASIPIRQKGLSRNAVAAAILLVSCLTGLLSWRTPSGQPRMVALDAYRGAATEAPAGQPLELKIDLEGVRPAAGYRVEIVDSTGRRLWFGARPVRLTHGLSPGVYWVRLLTDTGEALREYALSVGKAQ